MRNVDEFPYAAGTVTERRSSRNRNGRPPIMRLVRTNSEGRRQGTPIHGTGAWARFLARGSIVVSHDHARCGASFHRALAVDTLPREIEVGYLHTLLDSLPGVHVVTMIQPFSRADRTRFLKRAITRARQTVAQDTIDSADDVDAKIGLGDIELLRRKVHAHQEQLHHLAIYLVVSAPTRADLDARTIAAEQALGDLQATSFRCTFRQWEGLETCQPFGRDRAGTRLVVDTTTVAFGLPATFATTVERAGTPIKWGLNEGTGAPEVLDVFQQPNHSLAVTGDGGSGKSYCLKKVLGLSWALVPGLRILGIDPKDREYAQFCRGLDGTYVGLTPVAAHRLNPWQLPPLAPAVRERLSVDGDEGGELREERIGWGIALYEDLCRLRGESVSATDARDLHRAFAQAYDRRGISSHWTTYGRAAPTSDDIAGELDTLNQDLAERFRAVFCQGVVGALFNHPSTFESDVPVLFLDLHSVCFGTSAALKLVAPAVCFRLCMDIILSRGASEPIILLVDEGHFVISNSAGGQAIAQAARVSRALRTAIWIATQQPGDFDTTEAGRAFFTNAYTKLLLGQAARTDVEQALRMVELGAGAQAYYRFCGRVEEEIAGRRVTLGARGLLLRGRQAVRLFVDPAPAPLHRLIVGAE